MTSHMFCSNASQDFASDVYVSSAEVRLFVVWVDQVAFVRVAATPEKCDENPRVGGAERVEPGVHLHQVVINCLINNLYFVYCIIFSCSNMLRNPPGTFLAMNSPVSAVSSLIGCVTEIHSLQVKR